MNSLHKIAIGCALIIGVAFVIQTSRASKQPDTVSIVNTEQIPEAQITPDTVKQIEIIEGSTYGKLMDEAGVKASTYQAIFDAAVDLYDLSNIRIGKYIQLTYDKDSDNLKELLYQIDTEEELFVRLHQVQDTSTTTPRLIEQWVAERVPIQYEVRIVQKTGVVESSMYQAALDNDIDIRAIIDLANVFQWSVDFALDPRVGDTFQFIYEERYRNGEYSMPGKILAGEYVNNGVVYRGYYFEESEENKGYFDEDGNSLQKMFLKAPVAFKYISSGFTTGLRYVAAFNVSTGHRAIDYAAAYGTPIRAVGDGTVTFAGWSPVGYGNLLSIRHNGTYSTNYAHLSKFAVKSGQRVTQGQTIGYVGSTGFSTGPHLHYEMVKHGIKINPLLETLPPGESISDENKEVFFESIKNLKEQLNTIK